MRSLLRSANLLVLLTYTLLSLVPFAPIIFGKTVNRPLRVIGMEFIAWVSVWALFKRPAWFHLLLLPAFIALPVELYLYAYYGQGITTHHLGIIVETSPEEALEFLGNKIWLVVVLFIGVVAWWWSSWQAARRTRDLDWSDNSRWITLGILAVAFCVWLYGDEFGIKPIIASASVSEPSLFPNPKSIQTVAFHPAKQLTESSEEGSSSSAAKIKLASPLPTQSQHESGSIFPPLPSWAEIPFSAGPFGKTWPFGYAVHTYHFWKERTYLSELAEKNRNFSFGAHQVNPNKEPQVVVMVIGESSRYDRWSINGYSRKTNPLLEKESNLVSLSDMVTAVTATRLSVPIIVSRKPATQSLRAGFSEKSFLTAFKEAGFKTYWISNQMSYGQFDTPISVFANEADVTEYLNLGGFTDNSSFDSALLTPLKNAIADPAPKKLIVLHTLGSHWNYSHRYPKEFDHWKPSLFGVDNPAYTDLNLKPQLNNSYDNSILYTDWFLSQVIDTLKSTVPLASMMYTSDHGQTLYDGSCNLAFHGHNTQYEFHIPALVWYSDLYQHTYPDKVEHLRHNRHAKLSTENIFHSLLDMADIRYPTERLEWSFFNSQFKRHIRYVDSHGWADYDNSTMQGDCRKVVANGKTLAQEQ
jgi:glucan phosphoethanolaminetransferase (alkaline phosphatase superfamily)